MLVRTKCDTCGCEVMVEYSDLQVESLRTYNFAPETMLSRCEACQERLELALGYRKPKAEQTPAPAPTLSEQEVRDRLPLSTLAKSETATQQRGFPTDLGSIPGMFLTKGETATQGELL